MSEKHQIIFYPVGNGDTSQIVLSQGRRVLFDFCHRKKADGDDTPEIDLKTRLKDELAAAGRDYFDVVAFTHADADHIQGSTEFFELQHAAKYQGADRIKIQQLWVPAAMVLENASNDQQSEEFVILRQEARHRLLEGKDILVFSKPQALMDWLVPKLKERGEPADRSRPPVHRRWHAGARLQPGCRRRRVLLPLALHQALRGRRHHPEHRRPGVQRPPPGRHQHVRLPRESAMRTGRTLRTS